MECTLRTYYRNLVNYLLYFPHILGSWEIIEAIIFYNPLIDSSISETMSFFTK